MQRFFCCSANPTRWATTSADEGKLEAYSATPRLAQLDAVACRTLRNCMQDVFEDGPKRDRRLWLGDLRMQALVNYETFKNYDLVKRCLYLFAGTTQERGRVGACLFLEPEVEVDNTTMFDYSLFFLPTLLDYYKATGDMETLKDKALQVLCTYWGGMLEEGADTFWELYNPQNPNESPYGGTIVNSYCHAWSCAPAYFLRKFF